MNICDLFEKLDKLEKKKEKLCPTPYSTVEKEVPNLPKARVKDIEKVDKKINSAYFKLMKAIMTYHTIAFAYHRSFTTQTSRTTNGGVQASATGVSGQYEKSGSSNKTLNERQVNLHIFRTIEALIPVTVLKYQLDHDPFIVEWRANFKSLKRNEAFDITFLSGKQMEWLHDLEGMLYNSIYTGEFEDVYKQFIQSLAQGNDERNKGWIILFSQFMMNAREAQANQIKLPWQTSIIDKIFCLAGDPDLNDEFHQDSEEPPLTPT